ncbi:MAG: PAS domain S-box protein [Pedobacter sp.]|nr:MAG: PAS domain S-box protein [Pedobacter sp.]
MMEESTIHTDNIFFKKLVENSQEGISLIDKNLNVIYRSPSSKRIIGFDHVDEYNRHLPDMIHPQDVAGLVGLLKDLVLCSGQSVNHQFRAKHAKGHYIWVDCTYTNMLNESQVNAVVCNFRDISAQREAEEKLQRSAQELSAYKYALDQSSIVAITDQKGVITHVNDNFCKISKYSREELIGQDHRIINSSYHSKAFIRNLWVTIANGKIWREEIRNQAKDGSQYWVDTTIVPFLTSEGKPYQYVAIRSDITGRKDFEEQVAANQHFIKTITDHLPAMITYWTADLHCLFANKAFLSWSRKTPEEMHGLHKKQLLGEKEYMVHRVHIENVLSGKTQNFERTFSANGRKIYTYTQYVPNMQHNKVVGFYSLTHDYSDIKTAELEVIHKTSQIENLLENIADGFIALDENRCYTYANKQIGKMLNIDPQSLIGKNIWEVFPDALHSSTYYAIEAAFENKEHSSSEDYFAPLNLWQENRIYPSGKGLSIFIRDISERKNEEIEKSILAAIREIFNTEKRLAETLEQTLRQFLDYGDFCLAEAWLIDTDRTKMNRVAKFASEECFDVFFSETEQVKTLIKGEGLPGVTWRSEKNQFWQDIDLDAKFIRSAAATRVGLKAAYGFLLTNNDEAIGVILIGLSTNHPQKNAFISAIESIGKHLGAEIKRKQLEQELDQVFRFTPDILCITGVDGYFKKVNPAMCRMLEYTETELLTNPLFNFVYPDDREVTNDELKNIIEGRPTYYIENRYVTKSGKIKWLAWTTTEASEQGLLYCSAKDITDKKELEELLNKATALARIGGWEFDVIQNKIYWSNITREIHETDADYTPDFSSGISFYKKGHDRRQIIRKIKGVIETGAVCDEELRIVTAKGRTKWIRVIAEAEFAEGKCIRVYGSFQDIDALKRSEIMANRILEERNTILESIGDAFFAIDKNWVITYWNKTAEKVLHRTKEQTLNYRLWDVFSDAKESVSHEKYNEAMATNTAVHFEDHYPQLQKWYEISAYPAEGGLSVYFKDISDRKSSELLLTGLNESLKKQTKELAVSNAELEQFAYVASHDLQEPLRMITSFLTQLELKYGDIVDDRGKKYIHFAVDGAKRMRQIILDLLEFSRVGRMGIRDEEIAVEKIIQEVLLLFTKKIDDKQAEIFVEEMPIIQSSKAPIRQLFQNLIGNALKYKHPDRAAKIRIRYEETNTHHQFAISDNGIGIDRSYFDKIFIIFQRLHNKDQYEGTGMGLAISKKIVENLGGTIWLESQPAIGSTFYFTILKTNP